MTDPLKILAPTTAPLEEIALIVRAEHADPFHILGIHPVTVEDKPAVAIRAFLPRAENAWVVRGTHESALTPLQRIHSDGFFEAVFPDEAAIFPYRLRTDYAGQQEFEDPYRFPPVLGEFDLHLLAEGNHFKSYEKLGAHGVEISGVRGVAFAVWAPNAQRVSVVGNFNQWDGRCHPMRVRGVTGVWELFVPGLRDGEVYKFEIKGRNYHYLGLKADPYGFHAEVRPRTASIVYDINRYNWHDEAWMAERTSRQALNAPLAVYEVHLGSWRRAAEENHRVLNYRELADQLADYVGKMGFTHVELMPVMEHPLDESWGYQTTGYFAPTSRHGTPDDFMYFVDHLHQHGIGVILDWVPAHFPPTLTAWRSSTAPTFMSTRIPRLREHPDWGTRIFNYGRTEVRNFLWTSALFWLEKYHVDGLRVDAVASMLYLDYSRKAGEWVPNAFGGNENLDAIAFVKRFNELTHEHHPGTLTIAEESTAWTMVSRPVYVGGLGFSLKWNMGWMHDMLSYFSIDPIYPQVPPQQPDVLFAVRVQRELCLPLSHDEVVHGKRALLAKMPGDYWQQFANLRALFGFCTRIRARKCSSWVQSWGNGTNGFRRGGWIGICWNMSRTASCRSWWHSSTNIIAPNRRCTRLILTIRDLNGLIFMTSTIP